MMNQKKHSLDQSELELILSLSKAANFSPVCWKSISADEAAYKAAVFCSCFSLVLDLLDPTASILGPEAHLATSHSICCFFLSVPTGTAVFLYSALSLGQSKGSGHSNTSFPHILLV